MHKNFQEIGGVMEEIISNTGSDTNSESPSTETIPKSSSGQNTDKREGKDIGLLSVVLISLITSALSIFCYDHFVAQKIVVADLEGYMMAMKKAAETGQIGVDQFGTGLDEVKSRLDSVPKKNVILLGSVVLNPRNMEIIQMPVIPQGNTPSASSGQMPSSENSIRPTLPNAITGGTPNLLDR